MPPEGLLHLWSISHDGGCQGIEGDSLMAQDLGSNVDGTVSSSHVAVLYPSWPPAPHET